MKTSATDDKTDTLCTSSNREPQYLNVLNHFYLQDTSGTYIRFSRFQLIYSGEGHRPVRPKITQTERMKHMQKFIMAVATSARFNRENNGMDSATSVTPDPEIQTASSVRQRGFSRESDGQQSDCH